MLVVGYFTTPQKDAILKLRTAVFIDGLHPNSIRRLSSDILKKAHAPVRTPLPLLHRCLYSIYFYCHTIHSPCILFSIQMTDLDTSGVTKEVLEFRRCVVIAAVGSSPVESASVKAVLDSGYLTHVKSWYDQILQGKVGEYRICNPFSMSMKSFVTHFVQIVLSLRWRRPAASPINKH